MKSTAALLQVLLLAVCGMSQAVAGIDADVHHLQQRWAEINYQLEGKTRLAAFEQLNEEADQVTRANPGSAEAFIWSGIIKSTYAGAKGGLGALSLAKASRADLEKALALKPDAIDGAAYTSLGALYYNVPGWPIGFGDDKKAEQLLKKGLSIDPDGIDSNYFYGSFLISDKRYREAREYLMRARAAAPRPGRTIADAGRRKEIADALASIANRN